MQYNHIRAGTRMGNAPEILKWGNTCVREKAPKKKILRIYVQQIL